MRYLRHSTRHSLCGSSLVLVLLITALLTTVVISFLTTSRIGQLAAHNVTQKNVAATLAENATQLAMGSVALGFNTPGNMTGNYTAVVTTQPGAIHKFFFQNGTITQNTTVELFSSGNLTINSTATSLARQISNKTINLNNLSNPAGNATGNFTLTGNASEQINVMMEDVLDATGKLIGRIAYYVDDELTKININAATDNRTTLNVSTGRSISLSAFTSNSSIGLNLTSNQVFTFKNIVDSSLGEAGNMTANMTNWAHVFRNEQLSSAATLNATLSQLAHISSAPLSDFHLKYTPWGTKRVHINDESIDQNGVNNVYEALSGLNATTGNKSESPSEYEINGWALRDIYGQTFNDKYGQNWSWTGNMTRTANTTVNGLKQTIANMLQMRSPGHHNETIVSAGYTGPVISENGTDEFPPTGYYAHVPTGVLSEFAIKVDYAKNTKKLYVKPFIEIKCPFSEGYGGGKVRVEVTIQSITYTAGNQTYTYGPYALTDNVELSLYTEFQKCVFNGKRRRPRAPNNDNLVQIIDSADQVVGNPIVVMGDVKLYAGTASSSEALRDWIEGSFINKMLGDGTSMIINQPLEITDPSSDPDNSDPNTFKPNFNSSNITLQRIDPRIKGETAWVVAPHTFPENGNGDIMTYQGSNNLNNRDGGHNTWNAGYGIKPRESSNRDIPSDPSSRGTNEADHYIATERNEVYFMQKLHTLDATNSNATQTNATFNSPHDLGKVPTNVNWRRLRFMPRHLNESSKNLIPDWAMLDLISFSSNNSTRSILKIAPINSNGRFALDASLNNSTTTPKPRNNLISLIKTLEETASTNFKIGSSIARSGIGADMIFNSINISDLPTSGNNAYIRFRGTPPFASSISNNITSNSTAKWSTPSSTSNSTWSEWRATKGWPVASLVLPGEVTEIKGVADYGPRNQYQYTESTGTANFKSIKENEGRLTAFFPGLTLQSNFFTIYAYAQAGQLKNKNLPESESNPFIIISETVTKTLVEVEMEAPATGNAPAKYKVKKLYAQNLPLGE